MPLHWPDYMELRSLGHLLWKQIYGRGELRGFPAFTEGDTKTHGRQDYGAKPFHYCYWLTVLVRNFTLLEYFILFYLESILLNTIFIKK